MDRALLKNNSSIFDEIKKIFPVNFRIEENSPIIFLLTINGHFFTKSPSRNCYTDSGTEDWDSGQVLAPWSSLNHGANSYLMDFQPC